MTLKMKVAVWLGLAALTILLLWVFRGILLPFLVGLLLAYLLDPVTDWLERYRFSRGWATTLVLGVVLLLVIFAIFLIVPLIMGQIFGLIGNLPAIANELQTYANDMLPELRQFLGEERVTEIENSLSGMITDSIGILGNISSQVAQSGLTILNALGLLIVTPVVAFYLLLDWDKMIARARDLVPHAYREEVHGVFIDIDKAIAGFIRGQSGVVLILAAYYATALTLAGLNFGLAIGLTAGLLSFIPYVGFLVGFVLSIGVAIVQWWPDWVPVVIVLVIYLVGQFLEGNILYPKLVGSSIGVHPVWLMFALFAFALLFGAVGVLLAVPLAAITGVLVRYAVRKYKASTLYVANDPEQVARELAKDD
jgi:predicted PurR-regulated permease PerM